MSQEELSTAAELHRSAVARLEQGKSDARASSLVKIAGVLECEIGDLFGDIAFRPATLQRGAYVIGKKK